MGEHMRLSAADGHELVAYRADPEGEARGGVVVIQEIFGVNVHIRAVCDRFAAVGYQTIAPALYDRWQRDFECGYSTDEITVGREFKAKANDDLDGVLADVEAARLTVANAGRVGVTGFCWGGFVTWLAACRLDMAAAAGYYGGGIMDYVGGSPKCPAILHFGRNDGSIPMDDVEAIAAAHIDVAVHVYEADHGFNCDMRGSFDPHAAAIAGMRTIRLFDQHVAAG
jgi:carboxymethylenebutenolidase